MGRACSPAWRPVLQSPTHESCTQSSESDFHGTGAEEDTSQAGSVDFAFDGGTIKCEFGTKTPESTASVTLIVHPESMRKMVEHEKIILRPGTKGSAVFVIDADGTQRQLDLQTGTEWARERITEMSDRKSSVEENAFVAAVMHTLATGTPVSVWAADGVELLESGKWSALFRKPQQQDSDDFRANADTNVDPVNVDR